MIDAHTGQASVEQPRQNLTKVGGGDGFDSYVAPPENDSALDPVTEMLAFFQSRSLRV